MPQLANIIVNLLVYSDGTKSNKPRLRDFDWQRKISDLNTNGLFTQKIAVDSGSPITVISSLRAATPRENTTFVVENPSGNIFRWRYTGAVTAAQNSPDPSLALNRDYDDNAARTWNVTKTGNIVRYEWDGDTHGATVATPSLVTTGLAAVNDYVTFETGGPFNALNEGTFQIVGVGDDYFEVINPDGVDETAIVEGGTINSVPPIIIYSRDTIQIGDQVKISSTNFNIENRGVYEIRAVTPYYFEIKNNNPGIPVGVATELVTPSTPGAATNTIVFYRDIYGTMYLETTQRLTVNLNGSTQTFEVVPLDVNNEKKPGILLQTGEIFEVELVNNSGDTAEVKLVLME